jgi:TonB-linked SusC/RagA family outer membrane protein
VNLNLGASVPKFSGLKLMTSPELIEYGTKALRNAWTNNPALQGQTVDDYVTDKLSTLASTYDLTKTTDWTDLVYRSGRVADASISVRGGSDRAKYYFSYNYINEQGNQIGFELTRHMFRTRLEFDPKPYLSLGANLSGSFTKDVSPILDGARMHLMQPWVSPYNDDGSLKYSIFVVSNLNVGADSPNLLLERRYNDNTANTQRISGSFHGTLKPFEWLSFTSTNTIAVGNDATNTYTDSRTYSGNNVFNGFSHGTLTTSDTRVRSFLTSNIARAQFAVQDDHRFNFLVGQEWYERWSRSSRLSMYDQKIPGERNVGGFAKQGDKMLPSLPTGSEFESGSFSIFSELHYNYAQRYIASASFRRDASTNFGRNNRYGNFYSLGASWVVSQEGFMRDQDLVSNLKLRISYGTSGKEAGQDYLNYTLYAVGDASMNYYSDHPGHPASYPAAINQLGNDRLSWETAHNFNVGVDIGLFNQRLQLAVDKYRRVNSELIMRVTLPAGQGVGGQYKNVGEMVNDGVELSLHSHNVKGAFNWRSHLTFSYNKNKLSKLDNDRLVRSGYRTLFLGDDISTLRRIKVDGIDPDNGKARYERVEADGTINVFNSLQDVIVNNEERSYVNVGLSRAPIYGGFSNTFSWRGWELVVNTAYSFRYMVLNPIKRDYIYGNTWTAENLYRVPSVWKIWEKAGDRADLPIVIADETLRNVEQDFDGQSTILYSRADHWRISSIRLNYILPTHWTAHLGMKDATLHFLVDNVYTFSSKEFAGFDPENPADWAAPRRFIVGLNFNF